MKDVILRDLWVEVTLKNSPEDHSLGPDVEVAARGNVHTSHSNNEAACFTEKGFCVSTGPHG